MSPRSEHRAVAQTARKRAAPDSSAPQKPMMDKWRNFKEGIIDHFARGIIKKSETTFRADVLALKGSRAFCSWQLLLDPRIRPSRSVTEP
jgi:hypothetical protein